MGVQFKLFCSYYVCRLCALSAGIGSTKHMLPVSQYTSHVLFTEGLASVTEDTKIFFSRASVRTNSVICWCVDSLTWWKGTFFFWGIWLLSELWSVNLNHVAVLCGKVGAALMILIFFSFWILKYISALDFLLCKNTFLKNRRNTIMARYNSAAVTER